MSYNKLARKFCVRIKKYYDELPSYQDLIKAGINIESFDDYCDDGFRKYEIRDIEHTTSHQLRCVLRINKVDYPNHTYHRDYFLKLRHEEELLESEEKGLIDTLYSGSPNEAQRASEKLQKIRDKRDDLENKPEYKLLGQTDPSSPYYKVLNYIFYEMLNFTNKDISSEEIPKFINYLEDANYIRKSLKDNGTTKSIASPQITDVPWEVLTKAGGNHTLNYLYFRSHIILTHKGIELANEPKLSYEIKNNDYVQAIGVLASIGALIKLFIP